jgi:diguanylate cyclase (GGDEF)-like protein/PAS domain S-box-containing protein
MEPLEYERLWKLAEEVAGIGHWEWNIRTNETFWSPRKKEIYGLDAEEIPTFDSFLSVIDDETKTMVREEVEKVLSGEKAYYDLQHRIHLRDGREVWIHEKGYLIRDENGEPLRMVGIVFDITDRYLLERELIFEKRKSSYFEKFDTLTGLPNRHTLYDDLEHALASRRAFSLVFLDIEDFGTVNNTFGHPFGDRILVELARRLKGLVPSGQLYRYGADQFVLLVDPERAERLGEQLKKQLYGHPLRVEGQSVRLRYNIGFARYPEDAENLKDLIIRASAALTRAKSRPEESVVRFQPYMQQQITQHYYGLDALRQAIEERAFVPYYQPIVDTRRRKVIGVEALVRWIGPQGSPISEPAWFLPVAREHHLIHRVDYLVFEQALEDLENWHREGLEIELSCNAHLDDFSRIGFSKLFRRHQALLSSLIVEISEEEFLACSEDEKERMEVLAGLGIRLSLDDFGTGYSSLRYLNALKIHEIKIDREFISRLPEDPRSLDLIRVIKNIAEIYELDCVAEGVETREQSELLDSIGLARQQGFHFARPMPAEECTRFLREFR